MKKVVECIILILFLSCVPVFNVYAGSGCCSHHGGQSYCSNGRWICGDGSMAGPTCTCSGGSSSSSSGETHGSYRQTTVRTTTKITTRTTTTKKQVYGCMDKNAINYNSQANVSDGGCHYEKTEIIKQTINYDTEIKGELTNGNKKVVRKGENGEKDVTIKTLVNESGTELSRETISENIIKEPVSEIIKYESKTTKLEVKNNNDKEEDSTASLIIIIILLIINIFYGHKNKNANLVINKIKQTSPWVKYILYFLYFIFVIPILIDIVLIIIDLVKRMSKGKNLLFKK